MSGFDSLGDRLVASLRCPRCASANSPSVTYIEIDETRSRAYCAVCAASGPLAAFIPKEYPSDDAT